MPTSELDRDAPRPDYPGLLRPAAPVIPPVIEVQSHHHTGFITVCGHLVLQRRGSTLVREAAPDGRGYVAVRPHGRPGGGWCLETVGAEEPTRTQSGLSESEACALALRHASRVVGHDLRLAPFTAAYMYTGFPPGSGLERDRIVSPLLYEQGSDTVRIAGTNVCAASFPDGSFSSAAAYDDPAGRDVWPHIRHALKVGFHDCDRRGGDDHCKRRLAWFAGALWMDRAPFPLRCAVLRLDMSPAPVCAAWEETRVLSG